MIKRLTNETQRKVNKELKEFKNKEKLSQEEINKLVILIAKKLNIIE